MSNLILPNRRLFMQTLTAAFTGVVAAPVIIKAANLMEINSPRNRLIWAYDFPDGYGLFKESGINASHAWDAQFLKDWMDYNHHLSYSLRRAEEIHLFKTERDKRFTFNQFINLKRNGDPALLIPEPKKAEIIT